MPIHENPILLARQFSDLYRAATHWQQRLHWGDIDPSGPYIGRPAPTEREFFRQIRGSGEPLSLQRAWARWAFRLTEIRVNAPLIAATVQAYRVDKHRLEHPESIEITLRDLLQRTLTRPAERLLWADALAEHGATLQALSVELLQRRDEIARRAGYADENALTQPVDAADTLAEQLLAATDDVYREVAPNRLDLWLDAALAISADQGWPAQVHARQIQSMLGEASWLHGLDLQPRPLPLPIAASSFARSLYQLGHAIAEAAAPKHEPFVVAHDPYGLYRHTMGALCAGLTTLPRWHRDVLGLSRERAQQQARALGLSQLIHLRTTALALRLAELARTGSSALDRDGDELCHRALGFVLPHGLVGVLPRLRSDVGQRLFGPCLASRWAQELVSEFDEDWFRNPRGVEAVRARLAQVLPTAVEREHLSAAVAALAANIVAQL